MSELIRRIVFEHFRGLPYSEFKLKGKSLVLLGSNGKGKSAVVDGIEFVFSGHISRFVGSGTGSIDHDDAVQHVKKLGVPKVTISLIPSNGTISRTLRSNSATIERPAAKEYFDQHPRVDSFILRRAKILDFVCDQDADRYRKFVQLLGISQVDSLQRRFVDAERQAKADAQRAKTAFITKLGVFRDPVAKFEPQTLNDVLLRTSDIAQEFGLEALLTWADVEIRLPLLRALRPEVSTDKLDKLTRAFISFEVPFPADVDVDIATANTLRKKLAELEASSADALRAEVISHASAYLAQHQTEADCPVCERPFNQLLPTVLARLKQRGDALRELREARENREAALNRVRRYVRDASEQLKKDLEFTALIEPDTMKGLRDGRAASLRWMRGLNRGGAFNTDLAFPPRLAPISQLRVATAVSLKAQRTALAPPDSSKLEAAIALLERGFVSHAEVASAENEIIRAEELARRATLAEGAFSDARESAIQTIFEQIAKTVLDFYCRLHDCEELNERAECTALELKPTSRAAAGGLRLAVQFLGLANAKDPRAFLSEGHLDSLGLCLFLAAARIFNPPGSMLVLDDVLTSIDKEHRRRVGELLFQEFSNYQILLTTHDEHWHDLLASAARAWGIQDRWTFVTVENWNVDAGPAVSASDSSWEFIDAHLTETDYRELGGPFRLILEDFLKRTAVKVDVHVKYRIDGKYTAGDFVIAGIQDAIRNALIKLAAADELEIRTEVGRVFGQGDLVNFLSHDNPGRLEVTFDQAKDFVRGLRDLTKRCEAHKLIKGR